MEDTAEKFKGTVTGAQKELLEMILKVLEVDLVYLSCGVPRSQVMTLLINKDYGSIPVGLVTKANEVFEKFPGVNFRIYTLEYAREELQKGNLYFIRCCLLGELLYQKPESDNPFRDSQIDTKQLIRKSKALFLSEMDHIRSFKEGAYFYKKKKSLSQAAFFIHQTIELLYRCMENFAMGKSKICHRIASHLEYAHPFIYGAGRLFKENDRWDSLLLNLIDRAYCESRYSNNFAVSKKEIKLLLKRAEIMENQVQEIFEFRLEDCNGSLQKENEIDGPAKSTLNPFVNQRASIKDAEIDLVKQIVLQELDAVKIICFGHRNGFTERQSLSEEPKVLSFRHLYLLIITAENTSIYPNQISELIYKKTEKKIASTIVMTTTRKVQMALKKGNRFFQKVLMEGREIFNDPQQSATFELEVISPDKKLEKIKYVFYMRNHRANGFLKAAGNVVSDDHVTEICLLYLALQQICLGALYVVLGLRPDNLKLDYLLNLCSNFSDAPAECFPQKSEEDRRLYKRLTKSFYEVQYMISDIKSLVDADILHQRCERFLKEMHSTATEKIKLLEKELTIAP